jgi:hypothetical protein
MEISVAVDQPDRPARPGQRIVLQSASPPHVACPRAKQCETLSAITPSSRPISTTILPTINFSTVAPVKYCYSRLQPGGDQKFVEGRNRMGAASFLLTEEVVALGDRICRAPEIEIGECYADIGHERPDVAPATAGFVPAST